MATRGVPPAPGLAPRVVDAAEMAFSSFLLRPASSSSRSCVLLFLQSFGFSLLARWHYHWQLSFLQAERVLLEQLDEDGGCRRRCFQALRQMKEDVWCPGRRPVITSHHLQVSVRLGRLGWVPSASGRAWPGHMERACVCVRYVFRMGFQCPHLPYHRSLVEREKPAVSVFTLPWPGYNFLHLCLPFPPSPPTLFFLRAFPSFSPCLFLPLSSFYFTQQTTTSAHCAPETPLRVRKELPHVASARERSSVWGNHASSSDLR